MNNRIKIFIICYIVAVLGMTGYLIFNDPKEVVSRQGTTPNPASITQAILELSPSPTDMPIPNAYVINNSHFVSQTFNNCGPASLSMVMAIQGKQISQQELGAQMRPYQVPGGDNDDKSIFAEEFVMHAKRNGFESMHRANGDIELLKKLVSQDVPVVVRTWLNPNEDIGHFRIVRGYDESRRVIIQDDSYQGANLTYSYDEFNTMWQPFNYGYILVYPKEKHAVVEAILKNEIDEKIALQNSINRAEEEFKNNCHSERSEESSEINPDASRSFANAQDDKRCAYINFNLSSANYYLGNYQKSVEYFESAQNSLPSRMLWYQIEPIHAYAKIGEREKVFSLTDRILQNHNRAFSELYLIRGEIYKSEGNIELARQEFEKAVLYNNKLESAKEALENL